jgi:1-acyl-sn-glycerol-3-phosphate acyltransferase
MPVSSEPTGGTTAGTVGEADDRDATRTPGAPDGSPNGVAAPRDVPARGAPGANGSGEPRRDRILVFRLSNAFARFALWVLRTRVMLEGTEHIPDVPGVIVATNHLSIMDPVMVTLEINRLNGRRIRYMAKAEAMSWPVFGRWLVAYGGFPVRRGRPDREAYRRAREVLAQGEWLGLAPEGGRTRVGHLIEPKPGVALLAVRTGALVLPAGIWGSERLWKVGGRFPQPFKTVTIRFGEPYLMSEVTSPAASATERSLDDAGAVGRVARVDGPPRDTGADAAGGPAVERGRKRPSVDAASEDLMHRIARLVPREYRGRFG